MFNKSKQTPQEAEMKEPLNPPKTPESTPRTETTEKSDAAKTGSGSSPSLISSALHIKGNLDCTGDIELKGTVDGDVNARTVRIEDGGVVNGKILADAAHISGTVKGQIVARMIAMSGSAKVTGDILHETLSIDAGAFVDGNCRRLTEKDRRSATEQPAAKATTEAAPAKTNPTKANGESARAG